MSGKILRTWRQGEETFSYESSVEEGTKIHYGEFYRYAANISKADYARLLSKFPAGEYAVGTSKDDPPAGSVGRWMKDNVTKTGLMSYVGAILLEECYTSKPKAGRIKFLVARGTHK